MGYDPQRRRPRPRVTGDEPAPVDEILDEIATEHPAPAAAVRPEPQWAAPTPEPVAELFEPSLATPAIEPVPAIEVTVAPVRPPVSPSTLEPAVPTPARVADWRVAAAVVLAAVTVVLVALRLRRRRRTR